MAEKSGKPQVYAVPCPCGARIEVEASSFGRPRACPSCGQRVTVRWGLDPMGRERVPVVTVQPAPTPVPARCPPSTLTAVCDCGRSRPVSPKEALSVPVCPGCGGPMVVLDGSGPGEPRGRRKAGRAAPPPPPRPEAPSRAGRRKAPAPAPGKAERRRVPPPPGPAGGRPPQAAPPRPLKMGEFVCKCGAIQPPRTSRTGRKFTCASCGRTGHVEQVLDPETQNPVLKVFVTSEPPAPPSE